MHTNLLKRLGIIANEDAVIDDGFFPGASFIYFSTASFANESTPGAASRQPPLIRARI